MRRGWFVRLVGAAGLGILGRVLSSVSGLPWDSPAFLPWGLVSILVGVASGALLAPFLISRPMRRFGDYVNALPAPALLSGIIGMLVGLVVASLASVPLYTLDRWPGWGIPLFLSGLLGSVGLWLGLQREGDAYGISPPSGHPNGTAKIGAYGNILVDTSAIIDGRIADLADTGFMKGVLVVPRFVLDELRHIADSGDALRRNRGRRGLEVLGRLRKSNQLPLKVLDVGITDGAEVDSRLVQLAREMRAFILTTDYSLNRVAELQGAQVLNINELAIALKAVVLPGEDLRIEIVQEGKELGQGIGYLDDGTMVVIEGGRRYINTSHEVTVTRVLQTAAGRIIFAQSRV